MKEIDLNKSVYDLTEAYPELIEILKGLGFVGLANPELRKTHGRKTTLPQGCENHGININEVIKKLMEKGFSIKPASK